MIKITCTRKNQLVLFSRKDNAMETKDYLQT
jgi:hypothetical protein